MFFIDYGMIQLIVIHYYQSSQAISSNYFNQEKDVCFLNAQQVTVGHVEFYRESLPNTEGS